MDIKAITIGLTALLILIPAQGKDIYKCTVNGAIKYQEDKCDEQSEPIHLKELAAPLGTFDVKTVEGQSARNQDSAIKERIARRQKRIRHYRKKMESELNALRSADSKKSKNKYPRNSVKQQEQSSSLNSIASVLEKESVPKQMNVIINHYNVLIEAEQFQIELLHQELKNSQK